MTIAAQMGGAVAMTTAGHMGGAIVGGEPKLLEVRKAALVGGLQAAVSRASCTVAARGCTGSCTGAVRLLTYFPAR
jgi:hypothetical protein